MALSLFEQSISMTQSRKIDKVFAENLGLTFGGCVRDQATTVFSRDISKAAGVKLSVLPFVGTAEKRRFKAAWTALLLGAAIWAARDGFPEINADEKLSRKVVFACRQYAEAALDKAIFSGLSAQERTQYDALASRFIRLGLEREPTKEAFARAFLSACHDIPEEKTDPALTTSTSLMVGLAYGLFVKVGNVTRSQDSSYIRGSLSKQPQRK